MVKGSGSLSWLSEPFFCFTGGKTVQWMSWSIYKNCNDYYGLAEGQKGSGHAFDQ